jgi:hypothetical protein
MFGQSSGHLGIDMGELRIPVRVAVTLPGLALVDISAVNQMTFTSTREELRERLAQLEARGATGIIFGTSGYDVERELRA